MTAPRLSLDHARSFEVPCTFDGRSSVVHVERRGSGWVASARLEMAWVRLAPDGTWSTDWRFNVPAARCPSAQEAVDAAFATEQIEPRGDEG